MSRKGSPWTLAYLASRRFWPAAGKIGTNAVEVALDGVQVDRQIRIGKIGVGFVQVFRPDDFVVGFRPFAAVEIRLGSAYFA
jgi:hypothetical protein